MGKAIKKKKSIKERLHPNNKHRGRYDLQALQETTPELAPFVRPNKHGDDSIDFADPVAVKMLNKALLQKHYNIQNWEIPEGYLCPPIPGRADYVHHAAELLSEHNYGKIPKGENVLCMDVGTGANCIYPLIGTHEYDWNFIASEIDEKAIESAKTILKNNPELVNKIDLRHQKSERDYFFHVLKVGELIDLVVCNPPFHASAEKAQKIARRKVNNLQKEEVENPVLNFSGQPHELYCKGGEVRFITDMMIESKKFGNRVFWFTTLVSKASHLKVLHKKLVDLEVFEVAEIPMGTGNKSTRILAWTFLDEEEQKDWRDKKWK